MRVVTVDWRYGLASYAKKLREQEGDEVDGQNGFVSSVAEMQRQEKGADQ